MEQHSADHRVHKTLPVAFVGEVAEALKPLG